MSFGFAVIEMVIGCASLVSRHLAAPSLKWSMGFAVIGYFGDIHLELEEIYRYKRLTINLSKPTLYKQIVILNRRCVPLGI
jgi:hypothetical protein